MVELIDGREKDIVLRSDLMVEVLSGEQTCRREAKTDISDGFDPSSTWRAVIVIAIQREVRK